MSRYWLALSWHDSEPADIEERAKKSNLEAACILHDKDFNELATPVEYTDETLQPGEHKKTHRHWIFAFPNTTTEAHATRIIQEITNGNPPKACTNIKGAYAYLTHKHDPQKYQYDSADIQFFNGFAPENYFNMGAGEEDEAFEAVENIIDRFGIEEYCDLMQHLRQNNRDLARFVRCHTIHVNAYLRSKHQSKRQAEIDELRYLSILDKRKSLGIADIDPATGEVVD